MIFTKNTLFIIISSVIGMFGIHAVNEFLIKKLERFASAFVGISVLYSSNQIKFDTSFVLDKRSIT